MEDGPRLKGSTAEDSVKPPAATAREREAARTLMGQIGQRFSENRKKNKSSAFSEYQKDLAENMDTLVLGGAVTLKEMSILLMDLEAYIRSTSGDQGDSPVVLLSKFLRGTLKDPLVETA